MKVEGPFVDWPPNLLEEVMDALYAKRSGLKHFIHLVIQPQMTSFSIKAQFSIFDKSRLEYCISEIFFFHFFEAVECRESIQERNLFAEINNLFVTSKIEFSNARI